MVLIATIFGVIGLCLIAAQTLLRRRHGYLRYLGCAFIALGIFVLVRPALRWIPLLVACLTVLLALVAGYRETRERLRAFREDQQQREAAFGEYLAATTRKESQRKPLPDGEYPANDKSQHAS